MNAAGDGGNHPEQPTAAQRYFPIHLQCLITVQYAVVPGTLSAPSNWAKRRRLVQLIQCLL